MVIICDVPLVCISDAVEGGILRYFEDGICGADRVSIGVSAEQRKEGVTNNSWVALGSSF
jgi:hypothetical protein